MITRDNLKIGKTYYWAYSEPDGAGCDECILEEIHSDHVICKTKDGLDLWFDDSEFNKMFRDNYMIPKRKKYKYVLP